MDKARGSAIPIILVLLAASSLLAAGAAGAADLSLKAPLLRPPPQPADAVPMFGDFQALDSDTNIRRGSFKISENESPRPMDRVFFNYNYYSGVDIGTTKIDVRRETFGFEKTFLGGNASIGVRVPLFQNLDSKDDFGDISIIGKYAIINNPTTGTVLSVGLAITPPTGNFSMGVDFGKSQTIHSTELQPFLGWQYTIFNGVFVQGFSSVAVPTDNRDATFWFNSIGIGANLFHGGPSAPAITGIIPTLELHFNTPLDHQDDGVPDKLGTIVSLTPGVHVEINHSALFGLAIGVPLSGPRPYAYEAIANFNWRF